MNRRGVARRVFAANQMQIPSVIANMSNMLSASAESLAPSLLIATGDVLENVHTHGISAFTTWSARPLIAEVLARSWARSSGTMDESAVLARTYGEMVAIGSAAGKTTLRDCEAARNHIKDVLALTPPSAVEIRALITDIIKKCRTAGYIMIMAAQAGDVIHPPREISAQTHTFYQMRGHVIPSTIFSNADFQKVWDQLRDPAIHHIDIGEVDYDLSEDYQQVWSGEGANLWIGFYEGKSIQNPEKSRGILAAAIFCYMASITKNAGVTASWVTRRRRAFADKIPGVNLDTYVSEHIVKAYNRFYMKEGATSEEVYRQLAASWSMLQIPEGLPLSWLIEQSANNNVTCLTTIADVISKLKFCSCEILISQGIPVQNFVQALIQVRDLLRNPFCSVVRPTVQLRKYADLAYLCTYIKRELMKDSAFIGYMGQPAAMCSLTLQELQAIGRSLHHLSVTRQSEGHGLADIYRNVVNLPVREISGEFFVIGQEEQNNRILGAPLPQPRQRDGIEQDDQLLRAHWPAAARNLPPEARLVTPADMFRTLDSHLSDRDRAFNNLMRVMHSLSAQVPLTRIPENSIIIPSPLRQITAQYHTDLTHWGVEVDPAWLDVVPAYAPIEDQDTVAVDFVACAPRAAWEYPEPEIAPAQELPVERQE